MPRCISLTMISLLFGLVSAGAKGAELPTLAQLHREQREEIEGRFPARSDAEEFFLSFHTSPQRQYTFNGNDGRASDNHILLITWLSNDVGVAYRYSVSETGRVHSEIDIYNWAVQAAHDKELKKEQLKALRESIPRLPQSTARPPLNRTVYVSFEDNKEWRTEAYDSTKLPEELESVLKIVGERVETCIRRESRAK